VPVFPECHALLGTRGRPSAILPREQHSGKSGFPECPIFGTRGSAWHSGKIASPVVNVAFHSTFHTSHDKMHGKRPFCHLCGPHTLLLPRFLPQSFSFVVVETTQPPGPRVVGVVRPLDCTVASSPPAAPHPLAAPLRPAAP
jgi:hypothetical protein